MKKIITLILLLASSTGMLHAQVEGVVVDKVTKLPIPFASISYTIDAKQRGVTTNAKGKFLLRDSKIRLLTVSYLGYKTQDISFADTLRQPLLIELEERVVEIDAVTVSSKNNPALRIVRKVIENKDKNNFENYPNYSYRNYFKMVDDLKMPVEGTILSKSDSNVVKNSARTVALVSETVTECVKSGSHVEAKIIATRTSGMGSPIFGQASYMVFHKAISFYNHSVQILGETEVNYKMITDYLSPLSTGALAAYNFLLEEQYAGVNNDTIFRISYFPKKGKNFSGLMGTMFVSSKGYALASMVATPNEKGLIDFTFKQDYELVEGKWFPTSLEEEIVLLGLKLSQFYIAFIISSKIDSISFDIPINKIRSLDWVYLDEQSIAHSNDIISRLRSAPLSPREERNYRELDSMARRKINLSEEWIKLIPKLAEGKVSVKKIDVDLLRLYLSNEYEGSRWGLGLHTNEWLTRYVSVGGYIGYGTKDKKLKYGGELELMLNRQRSSKLSYSYQNTLIGVGHSTDFNLMNGYFKAIVAARYEYNKEHRMAWSYHILPPLKLNISASIKDVDLAYTYDYKGTPLSSYHNDALQLSLRYAVGERYSMFGFTRLLAYEGNPVLYLSYTRGADFMRSKGAPAYNKVEAVADIIAYNGRIGQSNLRLEGGYVDRSLPYGFLFTGEGSKSTSIISFVTKNTFQTMRSDEFLSDKYVHLFYAHNFGQLLLKTKWFRPEFTVAYNVGWGDISNASDHGIMFQRQNRLYHEAGLVIDNIYRPKWLGSFIGFGLGVYTRFGYYSYSKVQDNMAAKFSIMFSFKK
jgi:hypothetical protein